MLEIGSGIIAGTVASTATEILHKDPDEKSLHEHMTSHYEILKSILCLLSQMYTYFKNTSANTIEEHVSQIIYSNQATSVRKQKGSKCWLGLYILVPSASTFTVSVSGLSSFTWTPTVGTYNRWKYPDGTTIQLLTPANPSYTVDFLYTDDLTS